MKILENDFRKELYKNLTEAGYTKEEAQKIVGKKYYEALKSSAKDSVGKLMESIESDKFDFDVMSITATINELTKLKELIS